MDKPANQNKSVLKRSLLLFGCLILLLLGMSIGSIIGFLFTTIVGTVAISLGFDDMAALQVITDYLSFIGIWMILIPVLYLFKKNQYILREIGTKNTANTLKNALIGLAVGAGINGILILAAFLHGDISLSFADFQPMICLIIFICVLIQSSAEEFLFRGYLYQNSKAYFKHPMIVLGFNPLIFALLHAANEGATLLSILNIFLIGLAFTLVVYVTNSMWAAFTLHTGWNFTQNIIFGLPNSGITYNYSIFRLDAANANNSIFYNVGFGIEGTIITCVVITAACVALYLYNQRGGNNQ